MLLVAGCWLLVVGCWLLVVGCWLLVVAVVAVVNALCNEHGLRSWVDVCLSRMYTWAGHLARLQQQSHRLASIVLDLKNMQHSATMASLNSKRFQQHPGRYYVHTWESQYYRYFDERGEYWRDVALDRRKWHTEEEGWINSRYSGKGKKINGQWHARGLKRSGNVFGGANNARKSRCI